MASISIFATTKDDTMINQNRIETALMWLIGVAGQLTLLESVKGLTAQAHTTEALLWALGAALGSFLWLGAIVFGFMRNKNGHALAIGVIGAIVMSITRLTVGL